MQDKTDDNRDDTIAPENQSQPAAAPLAPEAPAPSAVEAAAPSAVEAAAPSAAEAAAPAVPEALAPPAPPAAEPPAAHVGKPPAPPTDGPPAPSLPRAKDCLENDVPRYAFLFFDHLYSEYLAQNYSEEKQKLKPLLDTIYEKRRKCKLTWSDIYAFDLALLDLRPAENLIRKAYDARTRYRNIAGQKEYDEYLASKPPDLAAVPLEPEEHLRSDEEHWAFAQRGKPACPRPPPFRNHPIDRPHCTLA